MTESQLNLLIGKSLDWYYKIPDDGTSLKIGGKRPFDGFGILNGRPIYWESKLLKKLESFSLKKIKQHQLENLLTIHKLLPLSICVVFIGVIMPNRELRLYYFTNLDELYTRKSLNQSLKAKELENLKNYCVKNGKNIFPLREVLV